MLNWPPDARNRRNLVAPDEKQATFTGEQQRGGVWFLMFIVLGLFSPGTTRRPPSKKKAKGNNASKSTPMAKNQRLREPATLAPASLPLQPTESISAAEAVADAGSSSADADAELEDVLASLMAEIDVADKGKASEAWPNISDSGSAASEASSASCGSDSGGDSDLSTTRVAAAFPPVLQRKASKGKRVKHVLAFDQGAYEAAFGDVPYRVAVTTLFVKVAQLLARLTRKRHCQEPMTVTGAE